MYYAHYHVDWMDPTDVWPNGAFGIYNITGDEIADRVVREKVNPAGWYEGKVIARHPWCGFLGMVDSGEKMLALIERHKRWVAYANARLAAGHGSVTAFDHWKE